MLTLGWFEGNRWSIECFFKASKSFLKLETEFQSRSYDAIVSHTAIVFTRYTIPEWIRRNQNGKKTYGELFYVLCEDIQDMDLENALHSLMSLFLELTLTIPEKLQDFIKSKGLDELSASFYKSFVHCFLLGKLGNIFFKINFSVLFHEERYPIHIRMQIVIPT